MALMRLVNWFVDQLGLGLEMNALATNRSNHVQKSAMR